MLYCLILACNPRKCHTHHTREKLLIFVTTHISLISCFISVVNLNLFVNALGRIFWWYSEWGIIPFKNVSYVLIECEWHSVQFINICFRKSIPFISSNLYTSLYPIMIFAWNPSWNKSNYFYFSIFSYKIWYPKYCLYSLYLR